MCGYCALCAYIQLMLKSQVAITLIIYSNGTILDYNSFTKFAKLVMTELGIHMAQFSAHSYRASSATTSRSQGFGNWEFQQLESWQEENTST